jgi:hypothetical protein
MTIINDMRMFISLPIIFTEQGGVVAILWTCVPEVFSSILGRDNAYAD